MARKEINFTLDTMRQDNTSIGTFKQLDDIVLNLTITENGVVKDLTSQDLKIYIAKADKTIIEQREGIVVTGAEEGTVKIELLNAATQVNGITIGELNISDEEGTISTVNFYYNVIPTIANDTVIESTNVIGILKELEKVLAQAKEDLKGLNEFQTQVKADEQTRQSNEELRVKNEESRESFEEGRKKSENSRRSSESIRNKSEKERESAEEDRKSTESQRETAELGRKTFEEKRVSAEVIRQEKEETRQQEEEKRVQTETLRAQAEDKRVSREETRVEAEKVRLSQEAERVTAENERTINEIEREQSEEQRVSSESGRVTAEEARVRAEKDREERFGELKGEKGDPGKDGKNGAIILTNTYELMYSSWVDFGTQSNKEWKGFKESLVGIQAGDYIIVNAKTREKDPVTMYCKVVRNNNNQTLFMDGLGISNGIYPKTIQEPTPPTTSPLKGKKVSFLGDSITTFKGQLPSGNSTYYPQYDVQSVDDTWWKQLINETGMILCQNNSWSSTGILKSTGASNSPAIGGNRYKKIKSQGFSGEDPDILIITLGTNDFGDTSQNIELGTYDGTGVLTNGEADYIKGYAYIIKDLQSYVPNTKIFLCTLVPRFDAPNVNLGSDDLVCKRKHSGNDLLTKWNESIKQLAETTGCEIIDFYKCGINRGNSSKTLSIDKLHPNKLGMGMMAKKAVQTLSNLILR